MLAGSVFQVKTTLSECVEEAQAKLMGRGQLLEGRTKLKVRPGAGMLVPERGMVPMVRLTEGLAHVPATAREAPTPSSRIKT